MSRIISVNYIAKHFSSVDKEAGANLEKSYTSMFDKAVKTSKHPLIPVASSKFLKVSKIQENPRDTDSSSSGKFTNIHIAIIIPVLMLLFIIMVIVLLWKNKK